MNISIHIHASRTPKSTHVFQRLNPAKKGGQKWEPVFYIEPAEKMGDEEIKQLLVKQGRATQREFNKNQVRLAAA